MDSGVLTGLPDSNLGRWAPDGPLNTVLGGAIRSGAAAGAYAPPRVWRAAQRPMLAALQRGDVPRPRLDPEVRVQLVGGFADDNALLSRLLGADPPPACCRNDAGVPNGPAHLDRHRPIDRGQVRRPS